MMKKILVLTVATGLMGHAALAANNKKKASAQTRASTTVPVPAVPATNSSSVSAKSALSGVLEKASLTYIASFEGPSLTSPLSSLKPDTITGEADPTSPLMIKNILSASYKFADAMSIGPVVSFYWKPVQGQDYTMLDPYLRLGHSKLVNKGDFNLAVDLRLSAPISKSSRDKDDSLGGIASKQITSYDIGRFSLVNISYVGYKAVRKDGRVNLIVDEIPGVEYKVLPNLSASLYYSAEALHASGPSLLPTNDTLSNWSSGGTDVEPGLSWDITPNVNFNPYLSIQTVKTMKLMLDSSTINALLTVKLM